MVLRLSNLFVRTLREGPRRCRGRQPQVAGSRWLYSPRRSRRVHLAASGPEGTAQGREHHP